MIEEREGEGRDIREDNCMVYCDQDIAIRILQDEDERKGWIRYG